MQRQNRLKFMSFQVPEVQRGLSQKKNNHCHRKRGASTTSRYLIHLHEINCLLQASLVACLLVGLPVLICLLISLPFWEFLNPILSLSARNTKEETSPKKKDLSLGKRRKSHHRKVLSLSLQDPFTILCSKANDRFCSSVICVSWVCICVCVELQWITLEVLCGSMFLKYQLCLRNLSRRRKFPVPVPVA